MLEIRELFIPKNNTINKKIQIYLDLFQIIFQNININYDFAIDNNFEVFEYNNFSANIKFNNFETKFNLIEENGEMGDSNVLKILRNLA